MHLLVDSNYLLRRAFHVKPLADLQTDTGTPTGAIYGFLKGLRTALDKFNPSSVICVFDGGHSARRMEIHPEYKQNRRKDLTEEELADEESFKTQRAYLSLILSRLGCRVIDKHQSEADDIIAYLTYVNTGSSTYTVVMSDDKDMIQLANPFVNIYRPIADEVVTLHRFKESTGLDTPDQFVLAKALQGDSSDHIPGVRGVGVKTAQKLVSDHKTLDAIIKHCSLSKKKVDKTIAQSRELVERNIQLIDLSCELLPKETTEYITHCLKQPVVFDSDRVIGFFRRAGFSNMFDQESQEEPNHLIWLEPFRMLS